MNKRADDGQRMITVTDNAKKQLKQLQVTRVLEPGKYLRLATPPTWSGEGDFGIVIDEEREGDVVVEDEGTKLLLIDPVLFQVMRNAVFDCQDSPSGFRFTLEVHG